MELIPAIDLLAGNCVRLHQGNYNKVTQFSNNPVQQALSWQEQGATRLHLVDLDGAKTGEPINDLSIREIVNELTIPIQLGGGIRSIARAEQLIEYGIDRVILGTIAIENPEIVDELSTKYPEQIIVGIDAKQGKVATRGWLEDSQISATELVMNLAKKPIAAIIFTDISTDGTLSGPNLGAMREIAALAHVPIIASGGIGSMADLISLVALENYGVSSVIVGRALYDGLIDLKEGMAAIGKDRLQDSHSTSKDYFA